MLFSQMFIPTTKETPKDAVLKSHQFLIRAGYIHQIGSGIYNFLPLGKKVVEKISKVVRDEMNRSGAQEILMGFVTPAELWKSSGRYEKYGGELLRFKDRKENEFVLGPTHEESVTEIAKSYIKSYKQLPLNLYQIHTKFRDELRPRFGLMRGREFIMKDSYSFHASKEDLDREFSKMENVYRNIFRTLDLDFRVVQADSGAIGGSGSKEFMVLADSGEDTIVVCSKCDYASNIEAAKRSKLVYEAIPPKAEFSKFHTPKINTIKKLVEFFKVDEFFTLKAVVKKAIFDSHTQKLDELVYFFLRGVDELETTKALNALNKNGANILELVDASTEELIECGLKPGFIGPYALKNITNANHVIFDIDLENAEDLICGANEEDYHFVGVDLSLFEGLVYEDIAKVKEGDKCPLCEGILEYKKGIEVGHIFKLGQRYSKPLNASFLDKDGKSAFFEMGCYGIGITRLLPAILEQKSDDKGCVWTSSSVPFDLSIIVSNTKDNHQLEYAHKIYEELKKSGLDILFDDRDIRFGSKMADFELIGSAYAIIVGKNFENGIVELVSRKDLKKQDLDCEKLTDEIIQRFQNTKRK
ncbi:proline--tRNA ligase [Helicobacter cappadocius]|uniref:Proline--tRNA ligase n=1 Tax=Helicobacter cappadocius TaxID=3063998 RepID=A0AA90PRC7_9HELI|nr:MULTISPECIES: proline--tRNA ligase [unclassified Helicobacter]MDO7253588.1 proline--tRNA ligase [Helicobacter sp. faydin-H75]MDP2539516.1 proline--tRNA ligase [Helicobacter sp. faydin-H76]